MTSLIPLAVVLVIFIPFLLWAIRKSAHRESVKGERLNILARVRLSLDDILKDKWFVFAVVTTVFLGLCILFSGGVYTTAGPVGGIAIYRVNRFTGETWLASPRRALKVEYTSKSIMDKVFDNEPPPPPPPPPAAAPYAPER